MSMDDFNQSMSLVPKVMRSQKHEDGTVTIQIALCDSNDVNKVRGYRNLTVPPSGNVTNDLGQDCGAPSGELLDAIADFQSHIDSFVNAAGQGGFLDI